MKHTSLLPLLLASPLCLAQQPAKPTAAEATAAAHYRNPIVQTCYTTDPAPLNVGDTVLYVFTGHDEDDADFFWMQDWRVYSTRDMVNWTDHGSPLALESFTWADDRAWAAQVIERGGKFYWYVCAHSKLSGGMAIGVAVADRPEGPYRDALGRPLYENGSWDHIDPTVWIDGDGQAWLAWGNPRVYVLQLQDDMIHAKGDVQLVEMTEEGFGSPLRDKRQEGKTYKDSYVEGPWLMQPPTPLSKDGSPQPAKGFYLLYAAGGVPEHISYSSAPSPLGPWHYEGEIMPLGGTDSFTNHCGVADFKGHHYFFYHTGHLPGGGGFGRSAAVEDFQYTDDGRFPTIRPTREGVKPIATFSPYRRVPAATMAYSYGLKTRQYSTGAGATHTVYVAQTHDGDWLRLDNVDFGQWGAREFTVSAASGLRGGRIELRADSLKGRCLGTVEVGATGGWERFETFTTSLPRIATGIHDLYLVFHGRKGPELMNLEWWQMSCDADVNMPILQTHYTADPAPLVVGDTVYLYVSHDSHADEILDERERNSAGFFMYDWLLYTSTDMVNWTDHGAVASLRDFKWRSRDNGAWAIQTVERDGKYYLYAPLHGHGIGVLVADSPYGPFRDPIGKPLVWQKEHWEDIDPTVFIDRDGQAWMYWGNPNTYYVRLGRDMVSTVGDIVKLDYHIEHYQEGPWLYQRNGHWYLAYASTCCPEGLGYAMADAPTGPWQSKGYVMAPTPRDRGNHPGIIDFKGKSYVFGQDYDLLHHETREHFERRSVSLAEMHYNADGTIQEVPYWLDLRLPAPAGKLNPYARVEAETMAWGYGLRTEKMGIAGTRELVAKARRDHRTASIIEQFPNSTGKRNLYVYDLDEGEYIRLRAVDFGKNAAHSFTINAAAADNATATISLHLDAPGGPLLGIIGITATGGSDIYRSFKTDLTPKTATGTRDLYLCIDSAKGDVRLDWWQMGR
ncbi:MAG: family 43 glycosylhydrolase [Bacteroidaceae bacterium]|nr:family 43 glycosylhydrolase [Bacteroidaceae bacterium]